MPILLFVLPMPMPVILFLLVLIPMMMAIIILYLFLRLLSRLRRLRHFRFLHDNLFRLVVIVSSVLGINVVLGLNLFRLLAVAVSTVFMPPVGVPAHRA